MKVLCIFEHGLADSRELILTFANKELPGAEIATGYWGNPNEDLAMQIRKIEVEGPEMYEPPAAFLEHRDAEILVGSFCPFSSGGLSLFPNLKVLGVIRAGLENVNVAAATKLGIAVVNAVGRNADSVSDFAVGLLLAECRNIARGHANVVKNNFDRQFSNSGQIPDLRGKTVGIFGFGIIGRLVAEKLSGFRVNVLVYDPFLKAEDVLDAGAKLTDKETLFRESDFISVHARYTEETRHVIGVREFALMKPTAYFINTARSGLVDYDALANALSERRIAGAGLDVFDEEPLSEDNPLLSLPNVTLTPHIAGATIDAARNSPKLIFERIAKIIRAEKPEALLNPEVIARSDFESWRKGAATILP
jgi:D-3-phosphoglycerate dehydrogenase